MKIFGQLFLIIIGSLLIITVEARPSNTVDKKDISNEIYLPLNEIQLLSKEKQEELSPLLKAIFSADFKGMNCTGTYISNEGHFITADHCIQGCFDLGEDWLDYVEYKDFEDSNFKTRPRGNEYFVFKRFRTEKIRDNLFCKVKVNGKEEVANLIVAGKGRLYPYYPKSLKSKLLKEKYNEFQLKGVWAASDFAILQLISKPRTECLPLGDREPMINEKLKTISYTCISTPSKPNNNSGDIPLYTEGVHANERFFPGESKKMLTDGTTPPNVFWSNLGAVQK